MGGRQWNIAGNIGILLISCKSLILLSYTPLHTIYTPLHTLEKCQFLPIYSHLHTYTPLHTPKSLLIYISLTCAEMRLDSPESTHPFAVIGQDIVLV